MHQPPGNLKALMASSPREAERILRCYERAVRYADLYRGEAELHLGFTGVLLEQLLDAAVVDAYRHLVDIPALLARCGEAPNIELVGTGYYHPVFPLIPRADWEEQLTWGRAIMERAFGRAPQGFWPPEMAFSMDMVPVLVKAGYSYVVVDGVHVRPQDGLNDIYRPYLACQDGVCITVVPRDRDLSGAQASGVGADWFAAETRSRTQGSPRPTAARLVTTWCDGENGDWFRQIDEAGGFFGSFFVPWMEHVRSGESQVVPVALSRYLDKNPPTAHARVQTGSWSLGSPAGQEFVRWAGSDAQRKAAQAIRDLSQRYWDIKRSQADLGDEGRQALARARTLILESQTSCFLFWGEAWIPYLYERAVAADRILEQAIGHLGPSGEVV